MQWGKKKSILTAMFAMTLLCAGCGPKEVGQNHSSDDYSAHERNVMDDARYPTDRTKRDGDLTQQRLYLINQPSYMINLDKQQQLYFQNRMGGKGAEEERQRPKQASPFKEQ